MARLPTCGPGPACQRPCTTTEDPDPAEDWGEMGVLAGRWATAACGHGSGVGQGSVNGSGPQSKEDFRKTLFFFQSAQKHK
jgi:hypothetical protein